MGESTTWIDRPESETEWRAQAARAHRRRARPGDEAAARTHELMIDEIRHARQAGTSREMRLCPRCQARGIRYALLLIGDTDRCGTCDWPGGPR